MKISLDFGGSTTDLVLWKDGVIDRIESFEFNDLGVVSGLDDFFERVSLDLEGVDEIFVTGGRSREFENEFRGILVSMVDEIEAIGRGGRFLMPDWKEEDFLVVSMGTGTCMVKVSGSDTDLRCEHIGGTGVGGGTFLALVRGMLEEDDIEKVKEMFKKGDRSKVDISVGDIVGGDIGMIKSDTTASNLGKLARNGGYEREDLACGIANLIGQVVATTAVFGARSCGCEKIVLGGKFTLMEQVLGVIEGVAKLYGVEIVVPERGEFLSVLGARGKFR